MCYLAICIVVYLYFINETHIITLSTALLMNLVLLSILTGNLFIVVGVFAAPIFSFSTFYLVAHSFLCLFTQTLLSPHLTVACTSIIIHYTIDVCMCFMFLCCVCNSITRCSRHIFLPFLYPKPRAKYLYPTEKTITQ